MATTRHCGRSWAWAITNERSGPNQGPKRKPRTRQSFFWVKTRLPGQILENGPGYRVSHKAGPGYLDLQSRGPDYLGCSFALGQVTWFGPDYLVRAGLWVVVRVRVLPPQASAAPA